MANTPIESWGWSPKVDGIIYEAVNVQKRCFVSIDLGYTRDSMNEHPIGIAVEAGREGELISILNYPAFGISVQPHCYKRWIVGEAFICPVLLRLWQQYPAIRPTLGGIML